MSQRPRTAFVGVLCPLFVVASLVGCNDGKYSQVAAPPFAEPPVDADAPFAPDEELRSIDATEIARAGEAVRREAAALPWDAVGTLPAAPDAPPIDDPPPVDEPPPVPELPPLEEPLTLTAGQLRATFPVRADQRVLAEALHQETTLQHRPVALRIVDAAGEVLLEHAVGPAAGRAAEAGVEYRELFGPQGPGATLRYQPEGHRFRQWLVLETLGDMAEALLREGHFVEWVEALQIPRGWSLVEDHPAGPRRHSLSTRLRTPFPVAFVSGAGEDQRLHFNVGAPKAWQAGDDHLRPSGLRMEHRFELSGSAEGVYALRVPAEQLSAPELQWPLYIDPDLSLAQGVMLASVHVAPVVPTSCDIRMSIVHGDLLGSPLNLRIAWDDGETELIRTAGPVVRHRSFAEGAGSCPGSHGLRIETCDDKNPPECDTLEIQAHPGYGTALSEQRCDFRCRDSVSYAFSTLGREECGRGSAAACADHGGRLEVSPDDSPILISEVAFDPAAPFIELAGEAGASLMGWQLEHRLGSTGEPAPGPGGWADLQGQIGGDGVYLICGPGSGIANCDAELPIAAGGPGPGDAYILRYYGLRRDAVQYAGAAPVPTGAGEGTPTGTPGPGESIARDLALTDTNDNASDFAITQASPGRSCTNPTPGNDRPVVLSATLNATSPTAQGQFSCSAEVCEPDGDDVTLSTEWRVNDVGVSTEDTFDGAGLSKGDALRCAVRANDGTLDSLPVLSDVLVVQNTAPVIDSVAIEPDPPSPSGDVRCQVNATDLDRDRLTVTYAWYVNGSQVADDDELLDAVPLARGDRLRCEVTVSDDDAPPVSGQSAEVIASNSLPEVTSIAISPTPATTSDALTCSVTTRDADGDSVSVTFAWFVNGIWRPEISGNLIAAGVVTGGDSVVCNALAFDGVDAGLPAATPALVIDNTPPTVLSVAVAPTDAGAGEALECLASAEDLDGDAVTLIYRWFANDVLITGAHAQVLPGNEVSRGNDYHCEVTPTDGIDSGIALSSDTVSIAGSLPQIVETSYLDEDPNQCEVLECFVEVFDADGDPLDVTIQWFLATELVGTRNIEATSGSTVSFPLEDIQLGTDRAARCEISVDDGNEGSVQEVMEFIFIAPAVPQVASARIVPGVAGAGDQLSCNIGPEDAACDGLLGEQHEWFVNGVSTGVDTKRFDTTGLNPGDAVSCELTPESVGVVGPAVRSPDVILEILSYDLVGSNDRGATGTSVALLPDMNGDGLGEVALGAPNADTANGAQSGQVLVAHGQLDAVSVELEAAIAAGEGFVRLGVSGDFDVHTGACGTSTSCDSAVTEPALAELGNFSPTSARGFVEGPAGDYFGYDLELIGDADGDGVPDLLASSPFERGNRGIWAGRARVFSGAQLSTTDASQIGALAGAGTRINGECGRDNTRFGAQGSRTGNGDLFGYAASAAGDVNGDGLADVIAGAVMSGNDDDGGVWVLFSDPTRANRDVTSIYRNCVNSGIGSEGPLAGVDGFFLRGQVNVGSDIAHYGRRATGIGDLNHDGYDDIATLGDSIASGRTAIVWGGPAGSFTSSKTDLITEDQGLQLRGDDFFFTGPNSPIFGDFLNGMPMGGGGDINGDGRADLVQVRRRQDDGLNAYVILGRETFPRFIDLQTEHDSFGYIANIGSRSPSYRGDVRLDGDFDGDGLDDIIVSHVFANEVVVVFGRMDEDNVPRSAIDSGEAGVVFSGIGDERLGWDLATGDINGDGLLDFVAGAPRKRDASNAVVGGARVVLGRDARGVITHHGDEGDNTLEGTPSDDRMVAGRGNDVLRSRGGFDVLYGGAGDDVFEIVDDGFLRLRGGEGDDTVIVDAQVDEFDLGALRGRIFGIERLQLLGDATTITIPRLDLLRLSPTSNRLVVTANPQATLNLVGAGWADDGLVDFEGNSFARFVAGRAELLISAAVVTSLPPIFTTVSLDIDENAPIGTTFGPMNALDPDGGDVTVEITAASVDGLFAIEPSTGVLRVVGALDHEAQDRVRLSFLATDDEGQIQALDMDVFLNDLNEPPVFANSAVTVSTDEGVAAGTELGSVAATDPDDGDSFEFSVASGDRDGRIVVDPLTGLLSVAPGGGLDFEQGETFDVVIAATDAAGASSEAIVTVALSDLDVFVHSVSYDFETRNQALFGPNDRNANFDIPAVPLNYSSSGGDGDLSQSFLNVVELRAVVEGDWRMDWFVAQQGGFVDADVPVDVDISWPDELRAGEPVTLDSNFTLKDGVAFNGRSPDAIVDTSLEVDTEFVVEFCLDGTNTCTSLADQDVDYGPLVRTTRIFGSNFNSVADPDEEGRYVIRNDVLYEVVNDDIDWTSIIDQQLPDAFSTQQPIDTRLNGQRLTGNLTLWEPEIVGNIVLRNHYEMVVEGVDAELILEDGTIVPFEVGTELTFDLPTSVDQDGDGDIDAEFRFTPRVRFENYVTFDSNGFFRVKLIDINAQYTNPFTGAIPVDSNGFLRRIQVPLPDVPAEDFIFPLGGFQTEVLDAPLDPGPARCLIFVHGLQEFSVSSPQLSFNYWGGSGQGVSQAKNTADQHYIVNYDAPNRPYWESAPFVATHIVNALSGGEDGLGNSCGAAEKYVIVGHSMGGLITQFILGNAAPDDPNFQPDFATVAAGIDHAIALAAPLKGSEFADAACGNGELVCALGSLFGICAGAVHGLQTLDTTRVENMGNSPAKPIYLVAGGSSPPDLGCLNDPHDGAVAYVSALACAGNPKQDFSFDAQCGNDQKMELNNLFNLDHSDEAHREMAGREGDFERLCITDDFFYGCDTPGTVQRSGNTMQMLRDFTP